MITHFVMAFVQISLLYCFIVALVLVLRRPMNRFAGAKWVYAMWISLLIPLVIFVTPNALLAVLTHLPSHEFSLPAQIKMIDSFQPFNGFGMALLALWVSGVFVMLFRTIQNNFKFDSAVRTTSQLLTGQQADEINALCKQNGIFPAPEFRYSPAINGPALLGIFNPVLILPLSFFDKFNRPERALMIAHELIHFQRKDAWWNLFFCVLRSVFWFNPLIHIAERRFRLDQELSCDRLVLLNESSSKKVSYAKAMLKIASPTQPQHLIGFRNNSPEILTRVSQLQHHKPSLPRSVLGPVGCAILLGAATLLSTPNIESNQTHFVTGAWCNAYQGFGL